MMQIEVYKRSHAAPKYRMTLPRCHSHSSAKGDPVNWNILGFNNSTLLLIVNINPCEAAAHHYSSSIVARILIISSLPSIIMPPGGYAQHLGLLKLIAAFFALVGISFFHQPHLALHVHVTEADLQQQQLLSQLGALCHLNIGQHTAIL